MKKTVTLILISLIAGLFASPALVAQSGEKPNFIFILTDDQRYDFYAEHGRFPWMQTPNLDRLAREGVVFENAFVTTSLCAPSRASFLTGVYPHKHQVIVNATRDYDPSLPNFGELLQEEGYTTGYLGKWHLGKSSHPRPGFDEWVSFWNQGRFFGETLNVNGEGVKLAPDRYLTDELNDRAVDFIRENQDGPFLLYLSHKAVHEPKTPAPRHADLYQDIEIPTQDNPADNLATKPAYIREAGLKKREKAGGLVPVHDSTKDMMRCVTAVDDGVGMIFEELERLGIADNTVVIYAGDNGYFMREHGGLHDKRKHYEASMRIPLLMHAPMLAEGETVEEMVVNIDLAPTLLELAGAPIPEHIQGESWVGVTTGERPGRERFLYEYFNELEYRERGGFGSTPTQFAIRTPDWKYVVYPDSENEPELYHLAQDPEELDNLAAKPEYADQALAMAKALEELMAETDFVMPEKVEGGISHDELHGD